MIDWEEMRRGEEKRGEGCRRMMDVRDRITIRYLLGVHCS